MTPEDVIEETTDEEEPLEIAPAHEQAADGTRLTAFRLRDRIFRAGCQKVPRFRFKSATKEDEEDEYYLDLFFKIVVSPDDMRDSDHASHCFRPNIMAALAGDPGDDTKTTIKVGDVEAEFSEENRHRLVVPATGDKADINYGAGGYTCDIRDLVNGETVRLRAVEGIFLRTIFPNKKSSPVAEIVIEVRGCPYSLGDRDWMRHYYHLAIVHTSEQDGIFEGQHHEIRVKQTPERILDFTEDEEDDDDGPPEVEPNPLDKAITVTGSEGNDGTYTVTEEVEEPDALLTAHNAVFERLWNFASKTDDMLTEAIEFAGLAEGSDYKAKLRSAFNLEIEERGYLDLGVIAEGFTIAELLKRGQRATNPINKLGWRLLAFAVEHGLHEEDV